MSDYESIGFVGGGNMGEAMIGALIRAGLFAPSRIWVSDVRPERLTALAAKYQIQTLTDNRRLFENSAIVVLAVKPQQMDAVLRELVTGAVYPRHPRQMILSIAAGCRIERIEAVFYAPLSSAEQAMLPIVRVMPNTPSLVGAGMAVMSPNRHAAIADLAAARRLLEAMGRVIELPEAHLDAVTAVSGSGPAYVFYLIEAMGDAAAELGLDPDQARTLILQTVKGAVALLEATQAAPETLRAQVTSPGGTTEAALNHLNAQEVKPALIQAILAAAARSSALSATPHK
jgi:pyrroline-5-carboxylate reductase